MPIAIPSRRGPAPAQPQSTPPPNALYLLMAAQQMHSEGRLLAPDQSTSDAKLASIPSAAQSAIRSQ